MTNSLFARLGDTAQGGSAALALARNMTPTLRFRLSEMAGDESGSLASRRAALALSLAESGALQ
jgi:hypothetical protein